LAACSCTVIPVASGLYYTGASIGVAFIILWVAPAANVLALIYTGAILGTKMVLSRIVSALLMAFIVGLVMVLVFERKPKESLLKAGLKAEVGERIIPKKYLILIILILFSLLSPNYLVRSGPYWHKVLVWAFFTFIMFIYTVTNIPKEKIIDWLRETWWFVRLIFPFLLLGVFIVGIIGKVLPEEWIKAWLGGKSLSASFFATLIGAVSYFATMTEAPFVDTLMKLGMGKGPALALLLTGPGISLPNWLAIAKIFGVKKALVYIFTITILGTLVGWFFGNFVF